jgi:hypothetical protein
MTGRTGFSRGSGIAMGIDVFLAMGLIIRLYPEYMPEPTAEDPVPTWRDLPRETLDKVYVSLPYNKDEEPWFTRINWNKMKNRN